jgi:hypothetical protein
MQHLRPLRSSSDLNTWGTKLKPTETGQGGTKPILPATAIRPGSDRSLASCGKPMVPQLRHARDPDGQMMFVAVWRCSGCGRITFQGGDSLAALNGHLYFLRRWRR